MDVEAEQLFCQIVESEIASITHPNIALAVIRQFKMATAFARSRHPMSSDWINSIASVILTDNEEVNLWVLDLMKVYVNAADELSYVSRDLSLAAHRQLG
jgi:hypothetical protein